MEDLTAVRRWTALLALSLGGFGIGLTEFVAMGLLPDISQDLLPQLYAQSPAKAVAHGGWMITAYALGVVVGAPSPPPARRPDRLPARRAPRVPQPAGLAGGGHRGRGLRRLLRHRQLHRARDHPRGRPDRERGPVGPGRRRPGHDGRQRPGRL